MGKSLFIAEKPSVAQEFARVLGTSGKRFDGYIESDDAIFTWCVGHLVGMSYPESYDPNLKRWSMNTLPFFPTTWKYEVLSGVKKQYEIVSKQLNRSDVDTIYVCTDSGREGEYIYRLVRNQAKVTGKQERRVWIDSQTEDEIRRGVKEAKDLSAYDALADAAYLRAKEDYLMGINFSRALTLKFGPVIAGTLNTRYSVVSVGRVMTCVLGMVVRREREIRAFTPTPFFRVVGSFSKDDMELQGEWRAVEGSKWFESPFLYKENGFKKREHAEELIRDLQKEEKEPVVLKSEKKLEQKKPPLLFNLAELQNEASKRFKISPDQTLNVVQELYEKKMVTYPRTDARVLSTAVAKEISKNIYGLTHFQLLQAEASDVINRKSYVGIERSMYTDDKKITDHYAIIPTGQGLNNYASLSPTAKGVYELIARRFLCIFYPNAKYEKYAVEILDGKEHFFSNVRLLSEEGYLKVWKNVREKEKDSEEDSEGNINLFKNLKKGDLVHLEKAEIKEGETSAPKRYSSGSLILAMENAGQLIEDEDLRAQIKGSGIGTSATRAEILKKLQTNQYLKVNQKTQIVTPELLGEMIFDVVDCSMTQLLNPELTASWEKGLSYVAEGQISSDEYMQKLQGFVERRTAVVKKVQNPEGIRYRFNEVLPYYRTKNKNK